MRMKRFDRFRGSDRSQRRVSARAWRALAAIAIVAALLISTQKTTCASPSYVPAIPAGVYNGPGAVGAHNEFESWLGVSMLYASDYVDYKSGWDTDFKPAWLIDNWSKWVTALPGRRLVVGLPMLESSNTGQFDQGASGAFDSHFTDFANALIAHGLGNSIIRLGYEANCDTIGPWQATDNPSGYVADFRHIVGVMHNAPGADFKFDWTVCNGLQNGHALNSFASFYPGDDAVDIIGLDQYDVKWMDPGVSPVGRWQYNVNRYMGLNDHRAFAAAHGKPVSFPEWGLYKAGDRFGGGGDSPYFIDRMADWIAASRPVYQAYFNLDWGGGVLANFPKGQAEYRLRFGVPQPVAALPASTKPTVTTKTTVPAKPTETNTLATAYLRTSTCRSG
jgi:hypothetical protein